MFVARIAGFCVCSMSYCALLCVLSSFAIILIGKTDLVASLRLSSWRLVVVMLVFLTVLWVGLQCAVVVIPHHTHSLFDLKK